MFEDKLYELLKDADFEMDYFYGDISEKKKKNASKYYNIPYGPEIIGLYDPTLFGSAKEGLAFCTDGCYWNLADESGKFSYDLLQDAEINFLVDEDDEICGVVITSGSARKGEEFRLFISGEDEAREVHRLLREIQNLKSLGADYKEKFDSLEEDEDWEALLDLCKKKLELDADDPDALRGVSLANYHLGDLEEALSSVNKLKSWIFDNFGDYRSNTDSEEIKKNWEDWLRNVFVELKELEGDIYQALEKNEDATWAFNEALLISSEEESGKPYQQKLDQSYSTFVNTLTQKEYNQRKIVILDEQLPIYKPEIITPLLLNNPGPLTFPPGHPEKGQVYVGHPFSPKHYYPMDTYEDVLFQSQVMEFNRLMQCLGATQIAIEHVHDDSQTEYMAADSEGKQERNTEVEASGDLKRTAVEGSANIATKDSGALKRNHESHLQKNRRMATRQRFKPKYKPYVPDDLVWFPHNETWQSLVRQRLQGGLLNSELSISIDSVRQISETEKSKIKSEFDLLTKTKARIAFVFGSKTKIKHSSDSELAASFEKSTNTTSSTEWKIYVDFAPLDELTEAPPTQALQESESPSSELSEDEQYYVEMLEDALEDGQISNDEKRFLDRQQKRSGISPERAKMLEEMVRNRGNFSETELEYLEELKFSVEDDGEISEDERRFLDRMKKRLGVSDERAEEMEQMVIKTTQ